MENVVLQVAEGFCCRAIDERRVDRALLCAFAIDADDSDLPANIVLAEQMRAGMRRNAVDYAQVLLAHIDQRMVFARHIVMHVDGFPFIFFGITQIVFKALELLGDAVGGFVGYVVSTAVHFPCGQSPKRTISDHRRAAPLAQHIGLRFPEDFLIGDIDVDVRQAARQNAIG